MDEEDAWAAWAEKAAAKKKQKLEADAAPAAPAAASGNLRPSRSNLQRDVEDRIDDPDYWRPPPKESPPANIAAKAPRRNTNGALIKQGNRWVLASAVATSAVWNAPKPSMLGDLKTINF